jgi:hypothetical protein
MNIMTEIIPSIHYVIVNLLSDGSLDPTVQKHKPTNQEYIDAAYIIKCPTAAEAFKIAFDACEGIEPKQ